MAEVPVTGPAVAFGNFMPTLKSAFKTLDGKEHWGGNGLCTGFCSNPATACYALCCTPCMAGKVTQKHGGSCMISCLCACCCNPCHPCCFRIPERKAAAQRRGVTLDDCNAWVAVHDCGPCALVQEMKLLDGSVDQAGAPAQQKM